ncbi:hypothetical protein MHW47_02445 [Streptomyces sp. OfavH-34-F]|uniref:hypothetical protein n=1 Tax=Streptomyces sp. OfavH-34-F TaxID=2917760 RepID=UPI001EF38898|nr:hypothetical protein [Streptomyces sp. OfavH-34-F]MCG7523309.1 hypothetical protein [Streptomyces sp. OfavH-34-F]
MSDLIEFRAQHDRLTTLPATSPPAAPTPTARCRQSPQRGLTPDLRRSTAAAPAASTT